MLKFLQTYSPIFNLREIERLNGLPHATLSKFILGKRELTVAQTQKLRNYFLDLQADIFTHAL